jgi:hypothetical protein
MLKKHKSQGNFLYRALIMFRQHPWLLLIALLLAVMIWLYVRGEIINMEF